MRRSRLRAVVVAVLLVVAVSAVTAAVEPPPASGVAPSRPTPAMRDLAAARGIRFGTAVDDGAALNNAAYATTLAEEFDIIVPENHLKWSLVHPGPDTYAFADADAMAAFAEANGMEMRGHTLAWWNQNPAWLTGGSWSAAQATGLLESHIDTVVGRYKGRLSQWDVYNESLAINNVTPWPSVWSSTIGFPAALDVAFTRARAADPTTKLFYNDFGIEKPNARFAADLALVKGMLDRGVPIDGVGFQAHRTVQSCTAKCTNQLLQNFLAVDALGLEVAITELDVAIPMPASAQELADQATVYRSTLAACLLAPNCHTFMMWGIADGWSWIPNFRPGFGAALPLDEQYGAKPAWTAMHQLLQSPPPAPSCSDYATQPEAQAAFASGIEGAPLLDPDGNGEACPNLPDQVAVTTTTPAPTTTAVVTSTTSTPTTTTAATVLAAATPVAARPRLAG